MFSIAKVHFFFYYYFKIHNTFPVVNKFEYLTNVQLFDSRPVWPNWRELCQRGSQ